MKEEDAPQATPKEMLYLELGCLPIRHIIKNRRLSFLHYLLKEDPQSMVHRFLRTQIENRNTKDWTTTVLKDIEELDIKMNFEEIKATKHKQSTFSSLISKKINENALKSLNLLKAKHSKVLHLKHEFLIMKKYLKPNSMKMKKEEKQTIFKLRCRTTDLKTNFKGMYDFLECSACGLEEESQKHILECSVLLSLNEESEETPNYANLFEGDIEDQMKIAKQFIDNMEIKTNLSKND